MASVDEILKKLKAKARPDQLEGMARYAITGEGRLGVSVPDMRKIAKELKKNHKLALELWKTGIPDARIMAGMIGEPEKLTEKQMEDWVKDFSSWDVCDQVCMNLFEKTPLAIKKIHDWSKREEESEFEQGRPKGRQRNPANGFQDRPMDRIRRHKRTREQRRPATTQKKVSGRFLNKHAFI